MHYVFIDVLLSKFIVCYKRPVNHATLSNYSYPGLSCFSSLVIPRICFYARSWPDSQWACS